MLSLTWSKKNILIGPEALHQDPRPKTQTQTQAQAQAQAQAHAGRTAAAERTWGASSLSEPFKPCYMSEHV